MTEEAPSPRQAVCRVSWYAAVGQGTTPSGAPEQHQHSSPSQNNIGPISGEPAKSLRSLAMPHRHVLRRHAGHVAEGLRRDEGMATHCTALLQSTPDIHWLPHPISHHSRISRLRGHAFLPTSVLCEGSQGTTILPRILREGPRAICSLR